MNALAYSYSNTESYRVPAGILALAVHIVFFAFLYFGINWRNEPAEGMAVDIWTNLPHPQTTPVLAPPPSPPVQKPVEAPVKTPEPEAAKHAPPKADIQLTEKKQPKKVEAELKKPEAPPKKAVNPEVLEQQAAEAEQTEQAAKAAAAITSEIGKYKGLIRARIRRNIVMPPDVPDSAQAEFDVILIPDGSVLRATLTRHSGNAAYDDAVERAILKAQPLPLPSDATLFSKFRELHLVFSPKE